MYISNEMILFAAVFKPNICTRNEHKRWINMLT